MASLHFRGTLLPEADGVVDIWVADGHITFAPQQGADDVGPVRAFILPGLVDCHAHLTLDTGNLGLPMGSPELVDANRRANLAAGVLLLRDIGATSEATLRLSVDGLPKVMPAGGFLAPPDQYFDFGTFVSGTELAKVAGNQVRGGAQWVKIIGDWARRDAEGRFVPPAIPNYSPEALKETVAAVHDLRARVAVHANSRDGAAMSIEAGVDSIEHGFGLDEELLNLMANKGIAWVPTLSAIMTSLQTALDEGLHERASRIRSRLDYLCSLLPLARHLGITILAGTDVLPHGMIAREVALLFQMGLEPTDALAAATTAARAFLRAPSLEEGTPADLVLYEADPRNDPEVLSAPALVMLGGRRVS